MIARPDDTPSSRRASHGDASPPGSHAGKLAQAAQACLRAIRPPPSRGEVTIERMLGPRVKHVQAGLGGCLRFASAVRTNEHAMASGQ